MPTKYNTQLACVDSNNNRKRALITGINGQDGSYLAELLLKKHYQVHATITPETFHNRQYISHLNNINLHTADLNDSHSIYNVLLKVEPHEVYNLAAQSDVKHSFDVPEMTCNTNGLGPIRLLNAIRNWKQTNQRFGKPEPNVKFYQASTSELFGNIVMNTKMNTSTKQNEQTPFYPRSPYACSKLLAHTIVINYREAYNMFAVNGILFNHESPRRGENFVSMKIAKFVAQFQKGQTNGILKLGNLDARRDWGHARDYVYAMWLMLQKDEPKDYVIATGESYTVRLFVEVAFECIGIKIYWENDVGYDAETKKVLVETSKEFLRPSDVNYLCGDASLAKKELGWHPKTKFVELVKEMVESELSKL